MIRMYYILQADGSVTRGLITGGGGRGGVGKSDSLRYVN